MTEKTYEHVWRPVAKLIPYAKNARTHSDKNVAEIAASIREFGFTNPCLIDERDNLIAGHGRVLAARKLGMSDVPCIVVTGLTENQRKLLILADNRIAEKSIWDNDLLIMELGDLATAGLDLSVAGWDDAELAALLGTTADGGLSDPDDTPSVPKHPVSRPGDLWIMGRHRLLCGDSTNPQHVDRLMAGAKADLCFTSPPYAQQRDYKSGGINDWDALMQGVFGALPVKHEAQVLVNLGLVHREGEWMPYWDGWIDWMRQAGWRRFGWYVWDQGFGLPGSWGGRLAPSHEFIFHFNRVSEIARKTVAKNPENVKKVSATKSGMRGKDGNVKKLGSVDGLANTHKIPDSVIRVMRQQGSIGKDLDHPAVFPVDFVSEMMTAFSDPDDLVFEPFTGSGTQIISAQKNGRSCFGLELAPEYTDVAVKRWQMFAGQFATLEGDGRTFDEIAAARPIAQAAE